MRSLKEKLPITNEDAHIQYEPLTGSKKTYKTEYLCFLV